LLAFFARIPSSSYDNESEEGREEEEVEEGGIARELEWKPSEEDCRDTIMHVVSDALS